MSFKLIPTPNFEKELKKLSKKYSSIKSDIQTLGLSLKESPFQGVEVFKSCYKIRFSIKSKGKGKRGGGRLITYVKVLNESVYLLSIYDKSERNTATDDEIKNFLKSL